MPPIVENFEIKKNNFSKWVFGVLTLLSVFALVISWDDEGKKKWIIATGLLIFGIGWLLFVKHKISVYQDGVDIQTLGKTRTVKWKDITALSFHIVYLGHSAEARLEIHYSGKIALLTVKEYQKKPIQRLFEVLNEQCGNAIKNDHFVKQATGVMNWRNKLKMF